MLRTILICILLLGITQHDAAAEESALERARQAGDDRQKIRILEETLSRDPGKFDHELHEQLRQLHRLRNPRRSAEHADRILQHLVMEKTVLADLEGGDGRSSIPAANRLIHRGHRWPDLVHLRAACSIRAAELLRGMARREDARKLLDAILAHPAPSLAPYRELAGK